MKDWAEEIKVFMDKINELELRKMIVVNGLLLAAASICCEECQQKMLVILKGEPT